MTWEYRWAVTTTNRSLFPTNSMDSFSLIDPIFAVKGLSKGWASQTFLTPHDYNALQPKPKAKDKDQVV